jgi:hypothetical protein
MPQGVLFFANLLAGLKIADLFELIARGSALSNCRLAAASSIAH